MVALSECCCPIPAVRNTHRDRLNWVDCGHSRKALESVANHPVRRVHQLLPRNMVEVRHCLISGQPLKRLLSMHHVLNASKAAAAN